MKGLSAKIGSELVKLRYEKTNQITQQWLERLRVQQIPVSGTMLKNQAIIFSQDVGEKLFCKWWMAYIFLVMQQLQICNIKQ